MDPWIELDEDALRQYIDAKAVFEAWESARAKAAEVRGGMLWRTTKGREYLIRTGVDNKQKSLGVRSETTEDMYSRFNARKEATEARLKTLADELDRHRRLNRAIRVGRAPDILVAILHVMTRLNIAEHFIVVGTHALYAYEAAAGVRLQERAPATRDVDLFWDTRKRLQFATRIKNLDLSMLDVLRKVDSTFEIRDDQLFTAVNARGFEVDILRREAAGLDPHPLQLTDDEDDLWAVQARRENVLLGSPSFSAPIVSVTGRMARMTTISPTAFVDFKRWMASTADRDPLKISRDRLQASIVEELANRFLLGI